MKHQGKSRKNLAILPDQSTGQPVVENNQHTFDSLNEAIGDGKTIEEIFFGVDESTKRSRSKKKNWIIKKVVRNGKTYGYPKYRRGFTHLGKHKIIEADSASEWKVKKAQYKKDMDSKLRVVPNDYKKRTFKEMYREFLQSSDALSLNTLKRRKSIMTQWILPKLGNEVVSGVTNQHVEDLYASVKRKATKKGNNPPKTVGEVHNVLNSFFNWNIKNLKCLNQNPISEGLVENVKLAITNCIEEHPLDKKILISDVDAVLAFVKGMPEEIVYHLQTFHGLRINEALGIEWKHVDFKNKLLKIRQQVEVGTKSERENSIWENDAGYSQIKKNLKGKSVRDVPLAPHTERLLLKTPKAQRDGFIYKNSQGTHDNKNNWRKRHRRILYKIGMVKSISKVDLEFDNILKETHCFRKFFASYLLRIGKDLATVSVWCGHKKQSTTLDYYNWVLYENENVTHMNNHWAAFDGGNESNISHAQAENETHPLLHLRKGITKNIPIKSPFSNTGF